MSSAYAVWKWQQVGDLLLICSSQGQLRDDDFAPCLELHRTNQVTRAITWALGNVTMSAAQRKTAGDAMGDHPAATITDSAVTRGMITAMAWMGKPWSAHAPKDIDEAVKRIGVPDGYSADEVKKLLHGLRDQVERELRARGA